jgi:hypothetical protein
LVDAKLVEKLHEHGGEEAVIGVLDEGDAAKLEAIFLEKKKRYNGLTIPGLVAVG